MQKICLAGKEKDRNCVKHNLLCHHPHQALKIAVVTVTEISIITRIVITAAVVVVVIVITETPTRMIATIAIVITKTTTNVVASQQERMTDTTMIDTKVTIVTAEMIMVKAGIDMILLLLLLLKQEAAEINLVIMMMTIVISNNHHRNVHCLLFKSSDQIAQAEQDITRRIVADITTHRRLKAKEAQEAMAIDPIAMIKVHHQQQQHRITMITMIREERLHNPRIALLAITIMVPQK